jgi:hypothetical protein
MSDMHKTIAAAAENALLDVLDQQPWWRRYANTITTAAGGIVTMGTWVATTDLGLPHPAQAAVGAIVFGASVVAARATRNGTTPRGSKELLGAVVPAITDALAPRNDAPGLDQLVAQQATAAADAAKRAATEAAAAAITGGHLGQVGQVLGDAIGLGASAASEAERAFLGRR